MQTKSINCKMKEIYYIPVEIQEEAAATEARFEFWNSMNVYAMQNLALVSIKGA